MKQRPEEELVVALADLLTPALPAPPPLRNRLLATVAHPRLRYAPLFGKLTDLFDLQDAALSDLFERAEHREQWAASQVPSTALLHLQGGPRVARADNGLVRLAAGARFPLHRHGGLERVLVLEGGYRDEPSGRMYGPGDLHEMTAGSEHAYVALPSSPLLLAVSLLGGVDVEGYGTLSPSNG